MPVAHPHSVAELVDLACGGPGSHSFEVANEVPGKGRVVETTHARVRHGRGTHPDALSNAALPKDYEALIRAEPSNCE